MSADDERAPYDPMPYGQPEVGVGPWEGEWPEGPQYDPRLLAEGDRRNVVDRYRYWSLEAIVADLDRRRHGFHVAIENWQHDFNIGTIVRSANAFLAAEVHIVGNRRWNRRGAMVTDRYQHVRHHADVPALAAYLREQGVALWGVDNLPGSLHLETTEVPERVCFLFGQEGPGLSAGAREACDATFSIAQFGSTRSINASAAAAIAMHAWVRAHADLTAEDAWRG
jgi:tRNA G18 (ribose-2'-O)-methylase SpoU